jgi:hypothetical protein
MSKFLGGQSKVDIKIEKVDPDDGAIFYITDDNHQWISEMTGLTLEEVEVLAGLASKTGGIASISIEPDKC